MRVFLAVEATAEVMARLAALQEILRGAGASVSWTSPAGFHVTLRFLGEVEEAGIPPLATALAAVAARHAPFAVRVAGAGAFPSARRPRTIWAGVTEGEAPLRALAAAVKAAAVRAGFPPEERPFRAHLTLGRVREPRGTERLTRLLDAHAADDLGALPVTAVSVMRSELSPQGARYTALHRLPLTGGDAASRTLPLLDEKGSGDVPAVDDGPPDGPTW